MTIPTIESFLRRLTVFSACLLMTSWLVAQTAPAKPANESKNVETSSAAADAGTKPHDNTFVIGNDDVLSINVWKEPDVSRSLSLIHI